MFHLSLTQAGLCCSPCSGDFCHQCKEGGSAGLLQRSAPASGCASAAALGPHQRAAGTLQPGQLWRRAAPAGEVWRGGSAGWVVGAGRGARAEAARAAVEASVVSAKVLVEAKWLAEVYPAPGSAVVFPRPVPHESKST